MLCEKCKKNEANFHITKIVNGVKEEEHLCEICAKENNTMSILHDMDFSPSFSFQNILSGFMDYMNTTTESNLPSEVICKECGTTYRDFKETGLLGCGNCYSTFRTTIIPIVKRVQVSTEHNGKIPVKSGGEILKKKELIRLKEELQKAIALEEYERAAELRDKIRDLGK